MAYLQQFHYLMCLFFGPCLVQRSGDVARVTHVIDVDRRRSAMTSASCLPTREVLPKPTPFG